MSFFGTSNMPTDASFFRLYKVYLRKLEKKLLGRISIAPSGNRRGRALLSYVTHPFTITKEALARTPHTNPHECLIIAEILLERGFAVDVIDWTNSKFRPKKKYSIVIDVNQNLERLSGILAPSCAKIFYATGAYWRFQNEAEQKRLTELKVRRDCSLTPRRQMQPSKNIEFADYVTTLGNNFSKETYIFSGKKIINIPLLSTAEFSSPENKNFGTSKKCFVWIGGGGAVLKGLDLVLEAFAALPDHHLTVCGPVASEKDFTECYQKELYGTNNITVVGRIDVRNDTFRQIVEGAVGLVYASCSEGQAGSVITGLHAGLIPIVTRESGTDVEAFGVTLKTASVEEIKGAVQMISALTDAALRERAVAAWRYARTHHTKKIFRERYAAFIDKVLAEQNL